MPNEESNALTAEDIQRIAVIRTIKRDVGCGIGGGGLAPNDAFLFVAVHPKSESLSLLSEIGAELAGVADREDLRVFLEHRAVHMNLHWEWMRSHLQLFETWPPGQLFRFLQALAKDCIDDVAPVIYNDRPTPEHPEGMFHQGDKMTGMVESKKIVFRDYLLWSLFPVDSPEREWPGEPIAKL